MSEIRLTRVDLLKKLALHGPVSYLFTARQAHEVILELPSSHIVPISWLKANASPSICWRMARDVIPRDYVFEEEMDGLLDAVNNSKTVVQIAKKQRDSGLWARNMLELAASKTTGATGIGTIHQYRRLLELGVGPDHRTIRRSNRWLFRLLSRDNDPALFFENKKSAQTYEGVDIWFRGVLRQAATCALAHGGLDQDPRVRGSAHTIATDISRFLRDDMADDPLEKRGSKTVLKEGANPPTIFSVAMVSYLASFQKERAGFVDRLGQFLGRPAPKKSYCLQFGRKTFAPTYYILGEPLAADSAGHPKDLPFALHWLEVLARLGALEYSAVGTRILMRLLKECDEGVWNPPKLPRNFSPSPSKLGSFYYPIEESAGSSKQRRTDVTFRLALIAKHLGWELEFN